jgi:antitoxin component YwqK of YwqJK toxin-antitoxin module
MKTVLFITLFFVATIAHGQHYYNDIKGTQALSDRMKDYMTNKVNTITATGFDENNRKTAEFNEWQYVMPGSYAFRVVTRNGQEFTRQKYQFDASYRLLSVTDTLPGITIRTTYSYDNANRIISVKTVTADSMNKFNESGEHSWIYNAAGKPEKMWRILNGKDSIEYRFTLDEKGNVADEKMYRWGNPAETVYYYYDESNRISDIIRIDPTVDGLLPESVFEYDDNNRLIQKTSLLSVLFLEYLIWRYLYNEKGLKVTEALFENKKDVETGRHKLKGIIRYTYTFTP